MSTQQGGLSWHLCQRPRIRLTLCGVKQALCLSGLTTNDGVGKGIPGHEIRLWSACHAAEHLALTHCVLPSRQLDDLCGCVTLYHYHCPCLLSCTCMLHVSLAAEDSILDSSLQHNCASNAACWGAQCQIIWPFVYISSTSMPSVSAA